MMTDPLDPNHNAFSRRLPHSRDDDDGDQKCDEFRDECAIHGIRPSDPLARAKLAAARETGEE